MTQVSGLHAIFGRMAQVNEFNELSKSLGRKNEHFRVSMTQLASCFSTGKR
jgi:hypothetical protein